MSLATWKKETETTTKKGQVISTQNHTQFTLNVYFRLVGNLSLHVYLQQVWTRYRLKGLTWKKCPNVQCRQMTFDLPLTCCSAHARCLWNMLFFAVEFAWYMDGIKHRGLCNYMVYDGPTCSLGTWLHVLNVKTPSRSASWDLRLRVRLAIIGPCSVSAAHPECYREVPSSLWKGQW